MVITEGVTIAFINYSLLKRLSLAFVRHTDTLNPRCVVFKVHKAFERELPTFIVRERVNLTRLKPMMPVKVVLQRMLTAEDVLSLGQGQRGVAEAMQILVRLVLE